MDEANLIKEVQNGQDWAFNEIVKLHKDKVFSICYNMIGNYHDANDIAQDVFIKVYKFINKFNFNSSFSTWITRIAINTCKDEFRRQSKKNNNSVYIDDDSFIEIKDKNLTPEQKVVDNERKKEVHNAISRLTPKYREVIILRDINNYSYEDIARVLKCSVGTVKSRINRARISLKEILIKDGTFL